ncbi:MAG: type II toxin-antitoxin system VapC family toxin [Anaerolineae bacterium]
MYLDSCCLQRPLDRRNDVRVAVEAEAVLGILALCEAGTVELVSSDALVFEAAQAPHPVRQELARQTLSMAVQFVALTGTQWRAGPESTHGIKPLDALHLASAEEAQADCLCTCDDRFLRRARAIPDLSVPALSPLELVETISGRSTNQTSG